MPPYLWLWLLLAPPVLLLIDAMTGPATTRLGGGRDRGIAPGRVSPAPPSG